MQKTIVSKIRQITMMAGIGLLSANCLMADLLPWPSRNRSQPIPVNPEQPKQPFKPAGQPYVPSKPTKKDPEPMTATMYGRLIYLGPNATADASHALCREVDDKMVPVCYIKWQGGRMEKFENHDVKVTGFIREMKGWSCPLLIIEHLENVEFLHHKGKTAPPESVFTPMEPQPAKPLPPPPTAKPLPPSQPAKLQPLLRQENRIMSPSNNDYKPLPPKAVNPVRTTP